MTTTGRKKKGILIFIWVTVSKLGQQS
jgi:hypothetical protein